MVRGFQVDQMGTRVESEFTRVIGVAFSRKQESAAPARDRGSYGRACRRTWPPGTTVKLLTLKVLLQLICPLRSRGRALVTSFQALEALHGTLLIHAAPNHKLKDITVIWP